MPEALHAFLPGLPALFSIVNPISGAFIFRSVTANRTPESRTKLAGLVALNALGVMMGALWAGSYVLSFVGISLAALRVAGGLGWFGCSQVTCGALGHAQSSFLQPSATISTICCGLW